MSILVAPHQLIDVPPEPCHQGGMWHFRIESKFPVMKMSVIEEIGPIEVQAAWRQPLLVKWQKLTAITRRRSTIQSNTNTITIQSNTNTITPNTKYNNETLQQNSMKYNEKNN